MSHVITCTIASVTYYYAGDRMWKRDRAKAVNYASEGDAQAVIDRDGLELGIKVEPLRSLPEPLRVAELRSADFATARVSLVRTGELFTVVRSLPPGMDIAPDAWRCGDRPKAEQRYCDILRSVEQSGFYVVKETTY